ncbi:hypothetical protein SORBI_3004G139500 [Sorghum bicolor]|uniref:Uncharacterized protein n=1 Tax=Sorghum bicolor TaxID=4558 RepID=A0A194YPN6_SORBI|nr:hypothetical protein SORBI_3004G139500 [Sorghum bicolor]
MGDDELPADEANLTNWLPGYFCLCWRVCVALVHAGGGCVPARWIEEHEIL